MSAYNNGFLLLPHKAFIATLISYFTLSPHNEESQTKEGKISVHMGW